MSTVTDGVIVPEKKKAWWKKWYFFPLVALLLPVMIPYWIIKFVVGGGLRWLWDEFLCFFFLEVERDQDGNPRVAYFMSCEGMIHFHPVCWGGFLLAAIQAWHGPLPMEWVALAFLGLFILSGLMYAVDFPFKRFLWFWGVILIFLPLADFGLATGSKILDGWLLAHNFPVIFAFLEDGIIRPLFKGIDWLDAAVSTGFIILFSSLMSLIVGASLVRSLLDGRWGFDGERLFHWQFGEAENSYPVYYQDTAFTIPDMHEAFFGFGAAKFGGTDKRAVFLPNIPFLSLTGKRKLLEQIMAGGKIDPADVNSSNADRRVIKVRASGEELRHDAHPDAVG